MMIKRWVTMFIHTICCQCKYQRNACMARMFEPAAYMWAYSIPSYSSNRTLPLMVFMTLSGCSKISFCMK